MAECTCSRNPRVDCALSCFESRCLDCRGMHDNTRLACPHGNVLFLVRCHEACHHGSWQGTWSCLVSLHFGRRRSSSSIAKQPEDVRRIPRHGPFIPFLLLAYFSSIKQLLANSIGLARTKQVDRALVATVFVVRWLKLSIVRFAQGDRWNWIPSVSSVW